MTTYKPIDTDTALEPLNRILDALRTERAQRREWEAKHPYRARVMQFIGNHPAAASVLYFIAVIVGGTIIGQLLMIVF